MLNDGTDRNVFNTRAIGASTPILIPSGREKETEAEKRVREYLEQDDCFHFREDKNYYAKVKEEADDDDIHWYPMYISYSRKERAETVSRALAELEYKTFLYTQIVPKDQRKAPKAPRVEIFSSMVFVYAMKIQLKLLKRYVTDCTMMKFVTRPCHYAEEEGKTEVIHIPQKQMENFMDAAQASDFDNQRKVLEYTDYLDKLGQRVIITDGPFKGIEGEIKRVERHRIVVVPLREVGLALGISHIPPKYLKVLEADSTREV